MRDVCSSQARKWTLDTNSACITVLKTILGTGDIRKRHRGKIRKKWSGRRDLNPRPSAPKADALPDCATPRRKVSIYLPQAMNGFKKGFSERPINMGNAQGVYLFPPEGLWRNNFLFTTVRQYRANIRAATIQGTTV